MAKNYNYTFYTTALDRGGFRNNYVNHLKTDSCS